MRLRLFLPRFHVNSDERDISTNIVYFLEFYASKCFFFKHNSKVHDFSVAT